MDIRFTPDEERFRAQARAWLEANRSEHEPPEHDLEARRDVRHRLAACAVRRRLGRHRVADGVRRPRRVDHGAADLVRGVRPRRCAVIRRLLRRPQPRRADAHRLRQRGAEVLPPAADPARRVGLVPGLLRAGRGLRPGGAVDPRRDRRRRTRRHRSEDLDELRRDRRLPGAAGAHRPRCAEAQGHHLGDLSDMDAPGITIRPITTMAGGSDFCEVFYDEVRIPLPQRGRRGQRRLAAWRCRRSASSVAPPSSPSR